MSHEQLDKLKEKLSEIYDLRAVLSLLEWDMEVMMPAKASDGRGEQLATMSALHHRLATAPDLGDLLHQLSENKNGFGPDEEKLIDESLYDYERSNKLPERLVKRVAEAQAKGYVAWNEARSANSFETFRPHLENLLNLQREAAELYGYEGSPYNAHLENFERGMRAETLQPLFKDLAEHQTAIVRRIVSSSRKPNGSWMNNIWDVSAQHALSRHILAAMGFDMEAGRLDTAPHPFCSQSDLKDVRLTTRYHTDIPFSGLLSTMHEGGHALYDQGFDAAYRRTPLADAPSLGIHECNSRMWENMIGRSRSFCKFLLPIAQKYYGEGMNNISSQNLYEAFNTVTPSLIRVEADECTYNLHIIIRFEIELALFNGELEVKEICEAWNQKYKTYLGLDVPGDSSGCLQDVHWSHGMFGYFPTYALGNLYAAQVMEKIEQDLPDLWSEVEKGQFAPLREWLRKHIHLVGRKKTAPEIIEDITGRPPEMEPFLKYLEKKYAEVYGI